MRKPITFETAYFGILTVGIGILWLRLHAFLALIAGAALVALLTSPELITDFYLSKGLSEDGSRAMAETTLGVRLGEKFGATVAKIGILLAMASVIGSCLLHSGAAERIVRE